MLPAHMSVVLLVRHWRPFLRPGLRLAAAQA
jgi:hypothetical protein